MAIIRAPVKFTVSFARVGNAEPTYVVRDSDGPIAVGSRAEDATKYLVANGLHWTDAKRLVSEARKWGHAAKWAEV